MTLLSKLFSPSPLRKVYKTNQKIIEDCFHLYLFKTSLYLDNVMKPLQKIPLSPEINLIFSITQDAYSHTKTKEGYDFDFESNMLGFPKMASVHKIFDELMNHCHGTKSVDEMMNHMYQSDSSLLIHLAENLKQLNISSLANLFQIINKDECNANFRWSISSLSTTSYNTTLLALNKSFWDYALKMEALKFFADEANQFISQDAGQMNSKEYEFHIININSIIKKKLT